MRKEDIQEDRFQQFVNSVIKAYYKSPRDFYIGAGVLVVAVIAVIVLTTNKPKPNPEANVLFDQAVIMLMDQQRADTATVEQILTELARRYPSHPLGKRAHFYLGNINYARGKYDDARREFEQFASSDRSDPWLSPSALMGVGNCYEQTGDLARAAAAYKKAYDRYPKWVLADLNVKSAGRCYRLQGKFSEAARIYERYLKDNPKLKSEHLDEVKLLLANAKAMASKR